MCKAAEEMLTDKEAEEKYKVTSNMAKDLLTSRTERYDWPKTPNSIREDPVPRKRRDVGGDKPFYLVVDPDQHVEAVLDKVI